jgi:hypothetical protein
MAQRIRRKIDAFSSTTWQFAYLDSVDSFPLMADQSTRRFKDETEKTYGMLRVLRFDQMRKGQPFFVCRCACGQELSVRGPNLRSGNTTSCGCSRRKFMPKERGRIQMQTLCGVRVWGRVKHPESGKTVCLTSCIMCRRIGYHTELRLRNRKAVVCECYRHTHNSWRKLIERCTNKNHNQYKDYGGRGVTVFESWRENFWAFFGDMRTRPNGTTIDRYPDADGNYEPGNCRWATKKQQAKNRRKPRRKQDAGGAKLRHG